MKKTTTSIGALITALALASPGAAQDVAAGETERAGDAAAGYCQTGLMQNGSEGDVLTEADLTDMHQAAFAALDTDGDDTVTREEYVACLAPAMGRAAAQRNVTPDGSGPLGPSGVTVEFAAAEDGQISRADYMEAAELAFDGTGNEEDNQVEWARAFIFIAADESEENAEVREMTRQEYAARAAMMFTRLDADGDGALSSAEWTAQEVPEADAEALAGADFDRLDTEGAGAMGREDYVAVATDRIAQARDSAAARGWEPAQRASSGGIGATDASDGAATQTVSGTADDSNIGTMDDAAPAGAASDAETGAGADAASATEASQETAPEAAGDAAGQGASAGAASGGATAAGGTADPGSSDAAGMTDAAAAGDEVPVFDFYFVAPD